MIKTKRRLTRINSVGTFVQQKPKTFAVWVLFTYIVGALDGELIAMTQTNDLHPWLAALLVLTTLAWIATFPLEYIAAHNRKVYQQEYWDKHWAD